MKVYLDSSVVMRRLLREPNALATWGEWDEACASVLMRIEARRAIDRLRFEASIDDRRRVQMIDELGAICTLARLCPLSESILERAAGAFPAAIRTLDALHLATAIAIKNHHLKDLIFLTHDARLALAARGLEFEVIGI